MDTLIFVTIRKGKTTYYANVSSFEQRGKDLWLYVWGSNGNVGDGVSRGTLHMINIAKKKGLKIFIFRVVI